MIEVRANSSKSSANFINGVVAHGKERCNATHEISRVFGDKKNVLNCYVEN